MKLFYKSGACSLSPHIALIEAGLKFETEAVDLKNKKTASGADFFAINPKGYVPALQLDNGQVLTEGAVIVQYIASLKPDAHLMPKSGSIEDFHAKEWLNYIASELHKNFGPLIRPNSTPEVKAATVELLNRRFSLIEKHLEKNDFLMGAGFMAPDCYLFTILTWAHGFKLELANWTNLKKYFDRVKARTSVQAAMKAEGLL